MLALVDAVAFEAMLFAAIGLLIGGLDDLGIDLLFLVRHVKRRRHGRWSVADLPRWTSRGTIAVFVPAWDEAAVIGGMLRAALARFDHADYRIYVGLYPNDPDCIAAARAVARNDARIRLVIGARDGPTTKADCLNTLWHTVQNDEAAVGVHLTGKSGQAGSGGIGRDLVGWMPGFRHCYGCEQPVHRSSHLTEGSKPARLGRSRRRSRFGSRLRFPVCEFLGAHRRIVRHGPLPMYQVRTIGG